AMRRSISIRTVCRGASSSSGSPAAGAAYPIGSLGTALERLQPAPSNESRSSVAAGGRAVEPPAATEARGSASRAHGRLALVYGALMALVAIRLVVMPWPAMWLW